MNLLIVDDHSILREGVAEILRQFEPGAQVLSARTIEEGLDLARQTALDAIFLDLYFPGGGGMTAIGQFAMAAPSVPVIILSSSENAGDIQRALAQGARGYVPKSASAEKLIAALRLVLAGSTYVPSEMNEALPSWNGVGLLLTGRQLEVLGAISRGLSNKDIGQALGLSEKTVKTHITAIFRALNVVNRTQAVNAARNSGLIEP
jgi:two-component system nitrate/nitrite response regulator NarL